MRQRRSWMAWVGALLMALGAAACSSSRGDNYSVSLPGGDDYMLGGQTGSLVPGCGVAPLSAGGRPVPAGDAVAVVYARECPEATATDAVALLGPGQLEVTWVLEPIHDGAFLVRAAESLGPGDYQVVLGGVTSTVAVDAAPAPLPMVLGTLASQPSAECAEQLAFELALSPEAAAHAPLMRWYVTIDDGREQLWVEYGAVELDETGTRARFELPRCGASRCLGDGAHALVLRAEVAGEIASSVSAESTFVVDCPQVPVEPLDAEATRSDADGCHAAGGRARRFELLLGAMALLGAVRRRRSKAA